MLQISEGTQHTDEEKNATECLQTGSRFLWKWQGRTVMSESCSKNNWKIIVVWFWVYESPASFLNKKPKWAFSFFVIKVLTDYFKSIRPEKPETLIFLPASRVLKNISGVNASLKVSWSAIVTVVLLQSSLNWVIASLTAPHLEGPQKSVNVILKLNLKRI